MGKKNGKSTNFKIKTRESVNHLWLMDFFVSGIKKNPFEICSQNVTIIKGSKSSNK